MAGFFQEAEKAKERRRRNAVERFLSRFLVRKGAVEQSFLQMVILLKGDVPVVSALETTAELAGSDLKAALYETADLVRSGLSLAKALRESMPWIGALFIGLVEVGESNGSLPQMFTYCANIMKQRRTIRNQIIRAMTYPTLVVFMGLGVGYYVSTVAIPKIVSVMGNPDALPAITRSLLTTSAWLQAHGVWVFLSPFLLVAGYMILRRVPGIDCSSTDFLSGCRSLARLGDTPRTPSSTIRCLCLSQAEYRWWTPWSLCGGRSRISGTP